MTITLFAISPQTRRLLTQLELDNEQGIIPALDELAKDGFAFIYTESTDPIVGHANSDDELPTIGEGIVYDVETSTTVAVIAAVVTK